MHYGEDGSVSRTDGSSTALPTVVPVLTASKPKPKISAAVAIRPASVSSTDGGSGISLLGPAMIGLGAPLLPKAGGVGGGGESGRWTSVASTGCRWLDATIQKSLGTNAQLPAGGVIHRALGTRGIGAAAGRAVPLVGWGITAAETGWELGRTLVETDGYQEFRRETLMPLRKDLLGY